MKNLADPANITFVSRPTFLLNRSFGYFWIGQSISTLGSQVTAFAVPLLAALSLHANAQQMGLLRAAEFAPFLFLTLPAGVWADLGIRKRLMISSNLIRAVIIVCVPLAIALGWARLEVLYLVMLLMGSFKVIFEMAYQTYIPEIVERHTLVNANSKIMMSYALGQSVGPGFGGIMVELLGAPMAVLTDATTYFLSAFCLFKIKHREVRTQRQRESIFQQIAGGFRFVTDQRHIRSLLLLVTANNFFQNAVMAILVLYATRDLGVRPGLFGITVSVGGLGAVMGAVGAEQLGRRFGPGPFVILSTTVVAIAALCFPLVHTGDFWGVIGLAAAYFVLSAGNSSITVFYWTIRQTLTPNSALCRMNGAFRFLVTGIMPFGAIFGGWLGETIGIRSTLIVSGVALVLVAVSGRFTPLMKLKSLVVTEARSAGSPR